jgi:hypothetical protein
MGHNRPAIGTHFAAAGAPLTRQPQDRFGSRPAAPIR